MAPSSPGDALQKLTPEQVQDLLKSIQTAKSTALEHSKLRKEFNEHKAATDKHAGDKANPHGVTKTTVGLDQVENLPIAAVGPDAKGYAAAADVHTFTTSTFLAKEAIFPMDSVVLGKEAGHYGGQIGASVLIGAFAGRAGLAEFKNYVAIGANTHPLVSGSVTIGNTSDTFTAPKGVVTRADKRDFTDVTDLDLGLDFVMKLKPRLAHMDLREDYVDYTSMPLPPANPAPPPAMPKGDDRNPIYFKDWVAYREAIAAWQKNVSTPYQEALMAWRKAYRQWQASNKLTYIKPSGVMKHEQPQAILLADEVANAASLLQKSFTGIVDFDKLQGLDVKGLRLEEMVPVLVKSIQELHAYVHGDDFIEHMVGRMIHNGQRGMNALRVAQRALENKQKEDAQAALVASQEATPEAPSVSEETPVSEPSPDENA
jgi:hypothetical protein